MKNSVECRFATIDDVEEIFAIDNSLFDKDKYSKQTFLDSIKNDIQKLVVAYDEQKIVGYILFSYILEEAELLKIGVMSKNQRQGIGNILHDYMQTYLKEHSVNNIFLEVRIDNNSAIKFYEKCGYEKVTIREKYYQGIDAVIYRKGI